MDNQFRLLREEMLGELRNDLQIARGNKPGKRRSHRLRNLVFHQIDCGDDQKRKPPSVALRCYEGIPLAAHSLLIQLSLWEDFCNHQS